MVHAARNVIEAHIINKNRSRKAVLPSIKKFDARVGVFVTLEHYPTKTLRGCIGFPRAVAPLSEALVDASIAAAFEDPRFVSVSGHELNDLIVEVSILSEPTLLGCAPLEMPNKIEIGRDGLMIEYGSRSGLLLPNVALEEKWTARRLLDEVCIKAGLPVGYWTQPTARLYTFRTQLFRETSPNGKIIEFKQARSIK